MQQAHPDTPVAIEMKGTADRSATQPRSTPKLGWYAGLFAYAELSALKWELLSYGLCLGLAFALQVIPTLHGLKDVCLADPACAKDLRPTMWSPYLGGALYDFSDHQNNVFRAQLPMLGAFAIIWTTVSRLVRAVLPAHTYPRALPAWYVVSGSLFVAYSGGFFGLGMVLAVVSITWAVARGALALARASGASMLRRLLPLWAWAWALSIIVRVLL